MFARVVLSVLALVVAGCASADSATSPEPADAGEVQAEDVEQESGETLSSAPDESPDAAVQDGNETSTAQNAGAFSDLCEAVAVPGSRVGVTSSGNRLGIGSIDFTTLDEVAVQLPDDAIWVVADPAVPGGWYVVLSRGSSVRVSPTGTVTSADGTVAGLPPELDGQGSAESPFRHHELFNDPLPDTRVVFDESIAAALVQPTNRYAHGVLGDELEAAAVAWVDTCTGVGGEITMTEPDVIEGISPILYDIDTDGEVEIIVTISNADQGARLAAFDLDGALVGESAPIGQGNRWRNQLAVGPFGPEGQIELIDVRTPHIGGIVEAFRLVSAETSDESEDSSSPAGEIIQVAQSEASYTSHVIGSRNLSLAIGLDANDDAIPDVITPSQDRQSIIALSRTADLGAVSQGWNIISERPLDNGLTGNIATQELSPGMASVAIPDGDILRIWR